MSDVITNMKVRFSADTKQFKKGMDEGQQAVKQFKNDAGNAFEEFASVFGVNVSAISSGLASANNSVKAMGTSFKAASAASGVLSKAMQVLKVALISTGIGALVVALGSLVAYFTKTERGAEKLQRVMAGVKAVFNVLIDRLAVFGEGVFKIFTGDFKGGWETMKKAVSGVGQELVNETKAAVDLERRLQELEDREISLIEIQSEREKRIAEARRLATDETVDAKTKMKAIREAFELEKQTLEENKSMQKERIAIMQEQYDMSEKTDDKLRELNEAKAEMNKLDTESSMAQKTLQKDLKRVTGEIEAETKALKEREAAIIEARVKEAEGPDGKQLKKIETLGLSFDTESIGLELDKIVKTIKTGIEPAKSILIDLSDTFSNVFQDMAFNMAESIGNMLAGAGGFNEIGKIAIKGLSDFAVTAGKIIMGAGLAYFALGETIKKAITNPATALLAVAAGAALVALGSAVSSSLSKAASGSSGTFSGNTFSGGTYDTRTFATAAAPTASPQQVNVNVTGEFRQRGTDMVATINETNKRSGYK